MKNYLITGAAGFIGSHLADQLLKLGHHIIAIDNMIENYSLKLKEDNIKKNLKNKNYQFYRIDIRNKDNLQQLFKREKIDVVIHLAGLAGVRKSIDNPIIYEEVNCIGTQNILECMKEHNIKNIIFSSSSSVYGNRTEIPFKETDRTDMQISPYAATKKADELFLYVYHNLYNINTMILRFFTVYGPRQRGDLAISKFVKAILENKPIEMYGDGSTSRDYTYIDDIIDGILKSIKYVETNNNVYEILNLGNSNPIKLKDMIRTIEMAINKKAIIINKPMQQGDVNITYAQIDKAKKLIQYEPKTDFITGINLFVKWFIQNKTLY